MGSRRRLTLIAGGALLVLCFSLLFIALYSTMSEENYSDKLISVLRDKETTTVQEVFTFEFSRAYVFNDCYLSGAGLAERYDLDISINEVETGVTENIQRIVFVDNLGSFVYEFRCDMSDVVFPTEGIIIYPETRIEKISSSQAEPLKIRFLSSEHYDSIDSEM